MVTKFVAVAAGITLTLGVVFALIVLVFIPWPLKVSGIGMLMPKGQFGQVFIPQRAMVEAWLVEEGQDVSPGQPLVIVRSINDGILGDTTKIKASNAGVIAEILVYPQSIAEIEEPLAIITDLPKDANPLELVGFVSSLDGKKLTAHMPAEIFLTISDKRLNGFLHGRVRKVAHLPMRKSAIASLLKLPDVAKYIFKEIESEPFLINISLVKDLDHPSGFHWSGQGISRGVELGVMAEFDVVYDHKPLFFFIWPGFFKKIFRGLL